MFQTLSEYLKEIPQDGSIATYFVPVIAVAAYSVRLVFIYGRLPKKVPIHFDFDGTPNGYVPRPLWAVFSPFVLLAFVWFLASMNRSQLLAQGGVGFINLINWGATGLTTGGFWGILTASMHNKRFNAYILLVGPVLFILVEYAALLIFRGLR
jgi:uncharacterized membrane protein